MQEIDRLLEELPAEAEIQRESGCDLPVVLEVSSPVGLLERNVRVAIRQAETAYASQGIVETLEGKRTAGVREKDVWRVLVVKLTTERNLMGPVGPVGIVLNLSRLHDAALWNVVGLAVTSEPCNGDARRAIREVGI